MARHRLGLAVAAGLLVLALQASAAQAPPKVGDVAPAIALDNQLQSDSGAATDWGSLNGEAIVLEFWATWCGACVAALPDLNQLARKFSDRPVKFINITQEDAARVEEFPNFKQVPGLIVLDGDRAASEAYGVHLLPRTFLIDPAGIIRGITEPDHVTAKVLDALLAGRSLSALLEEPASPSPAMSPPALFRVEIVPDPRDPAQTSKTWSLGVSAGQTMRGIIATAYEASESRVYFPTGLPSETYNLTVTVPTGRKDKLYPLARQALEIVFKLKVHYESRDTDVLVLTAAAGGVGSCMRKAQDKAPEKVYDGCVSCRGTTVQHLAEMLESASQQVVVDETRMGGLYDVSLDWDPQVSGSLEASIANQLGLGVAHEARNVRVLVVDHLEIPK